MRIKHVIDTFATCTGQLINPAKCSIQFSKQCPLADQEATRQTLQVEQQVFEAKYLGLPTPEGRMNCGKFQNLQSKLTQCIMLWGDSYQTQSGKEILIKSIAQALPTYVMGVFKLPFSVCDDLSKLIRDSWWGSENGKRKTHWLSWDKMTRTKGQGGIGFRDMRIFNQALLARQAWRLLQAPESLCARVLKARYYPQGNLLDTVFTGQPSSTWTAIAHGLELLKEGMIWRIGNGESVRIWRDNWLPRSTSLKPIGPRGRSRLIRVSSLLDQYGAWDEAAVWANFAPIDASTILKIRTSPPGDPDFLAWQPEKNGIFTVRSAYKLGLNLTESARNVPAPSNSPNGDRQIWKKMWMVLFWNPLERLGLV